MAPELPEPALSIENATVSYYLMKAEPNSRVIKGKDVKFSVDDFANIQTTAWEGVRNYEARNLMQRMKLGDKVLFYHSNTKDPGVAAFAEVSKEAYPDHTAWDETHPYYDIKSDSSSPKWYMVDLRFVSRVAHFVPLALLRHLSTLSEVPAEMTFLSGDDLKAIKNMALLNKGRLSVQRVEKDAWDAIIKIADNGDGGVKHKRSKKASGEAKRKGKRRAKTRSQKEEVEDATEDEYEDEDVDTDDKARKGKKRAIQEGDQTKRSKRAKK